MDDEQRRQRRRDEDARLRVMVREEIGMHPVSEDRLTMLEHMQEHLDDIGQMMTCLLPMHRYMAAESGDDAAYRECQTMARIVMGQYQLVKCTLEVSRAVLNERAAGMAAE